MRVAVVILNWNGKSFLEKFLPTVVSFSEEATVYVADNASTDDSVQFVKDNYSEVQLVEIEENLGFAGGYNRALRDLNEEFFVLLNSDVEVTPNWLEPLISIMDSDSKIAACQPKIRQYDRKNYFEYAGASGGYIDRFGYPFCRGRIFDTLEEDEGQYDSVQEVFWATGACLFIRGGVYKEFGGLDDDFFAHMEEIDLCWRINRAGYKIMVEPRSVVYHVGGGTLQKSNPHKTFLNFRNGLFLLQKNLPQKTLHPTLFKRMILDGVAALKFLIGGQPGDFWAVLRAHGAFYSQFSKTKGKRSGRYDTELNGIYNGSIVYEYFAKGKRKFSELFPNEL